jgi:hypothetical protein
MRIIIKLNLARERGFEGVSYFQLVQVTDVFNIVLTLSNL